MEVCDKAPEDTLQTQCCHQKGRFFEQIASPLTTPMGHNVPSFFWPRPPSLGGPYRPLSSERKGG